MFEIIPQEEGTILIINNETGEQWLWPEETPPPDVWQMVYRDIFDNVALSQGNYGAATPRDVSQSMSRYGRDARRNMGAYGKGIWDMNFGMRSGSGWGTTGWDPNPNPNSWGMMSPDGNPMTNASWATQLSRWKLGDPHPQYGDGGGNAWDIYGTPTRTAPVVKQAEDAPPELSAHEQRAQAIREAGRAYIYGLK